MRPNYGRYVFVFIGLCIGLATIEGKPWNNTSQKARVDLNEALVNSSRDALANNSSAFCEDWIDQICGSGVCSNVDPIWVKICLNATEDGSVKCTDYGSTMQCCCEKELTPDDSLWAAILEFLGALCMFIMGCIFIGLCCATEETCECLGGCLSGCIGGLMACIALLVYGIGRLCLNIYQTIRDHGPAGACRKLGSCICFCRSGQIGEESNGQSGQDTGYSGQDIGHSGQSTRQAERMVRHQPAHRESPKEVTIQESQVSACSVCMEEYPVGSRVLELPCGHRFHEQCVSEWLADHNSCPNCRAVVL